MVSPLTSKEFEASIVSVTVKNGITLQLNVPHDQMEASVVASWLVEALRRNTPVRCELTMQQASLFDALAKASIGSFGPEQGAFEPDDLPDMDEEPEPVAAASE